MNLVMSSNVVSEYKKTTAVPERIQQQEYSLKLNQSQFSLWDAFSQVFNGVMAKK